MSDEGGNRKFYIVDLRSFGATAASNTLILIDGMRVNTTASTGTEWTNIPLERIKRIEVVRGGRAGVLFGDNADGGVISIFTDSLFAAPSPPEITLDWGSFNTRKGMVKVDGAFNTLSFGVTGNLLTSDGYRDNGAIDSRDFGLNARYAISGGGGISFTSGFHQDKTGSPGLLNGSDLSRGVTRTSSSTPNDYTDATDYNFHARPEIALGDKLYLSTDVSFRKTDSASLKTEIESIIYTESVADTFIFSPQLLLNIPGKGYANRTLVGWDYRDTQEWQKRSLDSKTGSYNMGNKTAGYYLHDDLVLAERISISGGIRKEETGSTFYPLSGESVNATSESNTAGINYNYGDGSNLYMSYSNGFRFPLGNEIYDFDTESLNSSLKAQSSNDTELGFKRQVSPEALYTLNLFRLVIQREIVSTSPAGGSINLDGKTTREGVEFSYIVDSGLYLATLNWVQRTAKIESGFYKGKTIPGCANSHGSFNIALRLGDGMILAFTGNHTGERYFYGDFENAFDMQKPYTVYNARIAQKIGKLSAYFDINNFTDVEYSEYGVIAGTSQVESFHPSPERSYRLGISLEM